MSAGGLSGQGGAGGAAWMPFPTSRTTASNRSRYGFGRSGLLELIPEAPHGDDNGEEGEPSPALAAAASLAAAAAAPAAKEAEIGRVDEEEEEEEECLVTSPTQSLFTLSVALRDAVIRERHRLLRELLEGLYADRLFPHVGLIGIRLKAVNTANSQESATKLEELIEAARLGPKEFEVHDLPPLQPRDAEEEEGSAVKAARAVMLLEPPLRFAGFVDAADASDPYPASLWEGLASYLENLARLVRTKSSSSDEGSSSSPGPHAFRGGRYGVAVELQRRRLQFLGQRTLGELCHIVQLALQKGLLTREDRLLVPAAVHGRVATYTGASPCSAGGGSDSHRAAGTTFSGGCDDAGPFLLPFGSHTRGASAAAAAAAVAAAAADGPVPVVRQPAQLARAVEELLNERPEGLDLSMLKGYLLETKRIRLSETAFGFSKLLDLVRSPVLSGVCAVEKGFGRTAHRIVPLQPSSFAAAAEPLVGGGLLPAPLPRPPLSAPKPSANLHSRGPWAPPPPTTAVTAPPATGAPQLLATVPAGALPTLLGRVSLRQSPPPNHKLPIYSPPLCGVPPPPQHTPNLLLPIDTGARYSFAETERFSASPWGMAGGSRAAPPSAPAATAAAEAAVAAVSTAALPVRAPPAVPAPAPARASAFGPPPPPPPPIPAAWLGDAPAHAPAGTAAAPGLPPPGLEDASLLAKVRAAGVTMPPGLFEIARLGGGLEDWIHGTSPIDLAEALEAASQKMHFVAGEPAYVPLDKENATILAL